MNQLRGEALLSSEPGHSTAEGSRAKTLRRVVPIVSTIAGGIALFTLANWALGGAPMQLRWPALFVMKANTAAGLLLAAVGLWAVVRSNPTWRMLTIAGAVGGLSLSLGTLAEYWVGILHIDELVFRDFAAVRYPGRMSPGSAACLGLIDVSLLLMAARRAPRISQLLFFFAAAVPLAALGGYLYRAPGLSASTATPIPAVHTAVGQLMLCLGGLFARADTGLMRVVVSDTIAGSVARKLLPLSILLPLVIGLMTMAGVNAGVISTQFGWALVVTCCAMLFAAAVWSTTTLLWLTELKRAEERRLAEDALRVSEGRAVAFAREAELAGRMKDEFLSTLSHEIRTPLNAILGWSQLLSAGPDEPELSEGLSAIERNAQAQKRMIEDLLDMSRIISGKLRLTLGPVDPAAVARAACETVHPSAQAKQLTLDCRLPDAAALVTADADRLQQVLWNLLSNAVRFSPPGGRIVLGLVQNEVGTQFTVTDTGEGIRPDFLPHVFDRFRQADATTTRQHGGLGIGLAIVKQITESHGGTVHAHSDGPGKGATMTVTIPTCAPSEATAARPAPAAGENAVASSPTASLKGVRVLVVDDEPDSRAMMRRALIALRADVIVAASAAEALDHFVADPPSLVISDIGMPGMDGYGLIGRIRASERGVARVPAVAVTAFAREEDRAKAIAAGFDRHVAKPVEPATLVRVALALLGDQPDLPRPAIAS